MFAVKSLSRQLLLENFFIKVHFFSALQYFQCYYEYPVKQAAFSYLKLPFMPFKHTFLVCFCCFWKVKSLLVLNLFTSEYLDKILP